MTDTTTYDPKAHTDQLFPRGRPECRNRDGKPVYMGGLCGDCYAEQGKAEREAAR